MGHSFGGYTALVVGGAEVDGKAAAERFGDRVDFKTYRRPDERAAVIVAYAPVGPPIFSTEGLKKVTKPLLVFGGTNDQILPFDQHQAPIFEFAGGPCYLAALQGGSHFAFNNAALTALVGFVKPKRKVEELVDRKVADELVKAVTLAFLERHLLGDDRWATALAARPPILTLKVKNVESSTPAPR
jgi:predicted dienelactone hydrolase